MDKKKQQRANKLGNLHKTPLQRLCTVGFNWLEWSGENSNNHLPIHPCAAVCSLQRTPYQSPLFFQERPRVFTKRCQWRLTDNGPCRASWHNGYRWHGFIVSELPDCTRQNATQPSRTSSQDSFAIRAVSDHDGGGRRDRTNEIHNYENVQLFVTRSQLVPVPACVCVDACLWVAVWGPWDMAWEVPGRHHTTGPNTRKSMEKRRNPEPATLCRMIGKCWPTRSTLRRVLGVVLFACSSKWQHKFAYLCVCDEFVRVFNVRRETKTTRQAESQARSEVGLIIRCITSSFLLCWKGLFSLWDV